MRMAYKVLHTKDNSADVYLGYVPFLPSKWEQFSTVHNGAKNCNCRTDSNRHLTNM